MNLTPPPQSPHVVDALVVWRFDGSRYVSERIAPLVRALETAAVRLEILTARLRWCHGETGKHELLDEAEMFCAEARAALVQALNGEPK